MSTEKTGDRIGPAGQIKAMQAGGPPGRIFPAGEAVTPAGPGGEPCRLLDEHTCIVALVLEDLSGVLRRPGSLCGSCRHAMGGAVEILARIAGGEGGSAAIEALDAACEDLRGCTCSAALQAAEELSTALSHFRGEFESHASGEICAAGVCRKLLPAPCHKACPAGIDIPSYLALVAKGRYSEALDVIRRDNPFAWVCGLICPHPCEKSCVRANLDAPVNIRYLKAFAAERATVLSGYPSPSPAPPNGYRVAVVGSGPAGLSAAHFLALRGCAVTVFEALPTAGGLLAFGIPEYRLPRRVIQREIDAIRSMGVEIRTGITIGRDTTLDELRERGFNAFFLGIGAHRGHRLGIPGEEEYPQVHEAIAFLRQVNLGKQVKPAERVVVVGGGNSAMDAARTCLRLGCGEVHIAYRRSRSEMPANPQEVEEAMEEGVQFHFLAVPIKVGGTNGRVEYLECLQAELGKPDASGRRRPVPVEGTNFRIDTGAVIAAIGQQPDFRCFDEEAPVKITARNLILTDRTGTRTNVPDIFAGGDAVTGPATVVQAIAAGKRAAFDIVRYLSGSTEPVSSTDVRKRRRESFVPMEAGEKIAAGRSEAPLVAPEVRRESFDPVELGLAESLARQEASRCLRCDICIRCGECEKVCGESMQVHALEFKAISTDERILGDYERPKDRCIGCGACALACPTGAIEIVDSPGFREMRLCGTVLNRLPLPRCGACGSPFVPERFLEFVTGRSDAVMGKKVARTLCPDCAREARARDFVRPG
ncbi:MAG: NAD(P)-binding protein [Syntrophobacteraceae bacterium]|nr:FAD-dependent oxidoreductase [Desulfobacteraceae bacterium]